MKDVDREDWYTEKVEQKRRSENTANSLLTTGSQVRVLLGSPIIGIVKAPKMDAFSFWYRPVRAEQGKIT